MKCRREFGICSGYEDAIKNTLTVIREWIETASELGREIPIPKGRLIYA